MKKKKSGRISNQNKKQMQKKRPRNRGGRRFRVNREYKDRLFCKVFEDRKDLLDLYNAMNGTNYTDPEALTVNTLDSAVCMKAMWRHRGSGSTAENGFLFQRPST